MPWEILDPESLQRLRTWLDIFTDKTRKSDAVCDETVVFPHPVAGQLHGLTNKWSSVGGSLGPARRSH